MTDADQQSAIAARKAVEAASYMNEAEARRAAGDNDRLLRIFGPQASVVLGDAFDPTDRGPLGPVACQDREEI